jgi:hypothetical protein
MNAELPDYPAGKVDYYDIGACFDVWRVLGAPS